jgi:outer membrane protein assembly factor BamB
LRPALPYALREDVPVLVDNPFPPSRFACNDRLLFFMLDDRLLLALEARSGKVAWSFWAPGGKLRPMESGGRFTPHYAAGERFVLVQTTAGRRLTLNSQDGRPLHEAAVPTPWHRPPLALDERRFVLADEAGGVQLLDAESGRLLWTHHPLGYTSLTGAAPQTFGDKITLLALVPRNIGPDLVRLDPLDGKALWTVAALSDEFDASTAAFDASAVYFVCKGTLQARALADGRLLWQKKLPGDFARWQARRSGATLFLVPQDDLPLAWLATFPQLARKERAILALNPRDGQWLQRLPLGDKPDGITLHLQGDRLAVATGGTLTIFRPPGE